MAHEEHRNRKRGLEYFFAFGKIHPAMIKAPGRSTRSSGYIGESARIPSLCSDPRGITLKNPIEEVYGLVNHALPVEIRSRIKFLRTDKLPPKGGSIGMRGRILGTKTCGVWSPRWCFYEIGVGTYSASPNQTVGAIGLVSFPDNKDCGGGRNRKFLTGYMRRIVSRYTGFTAPGVSDPFQGAFRYYEDSSFQTFPVSQAAADLVALICGTFDDIDGLQS